MIRTYPIPCRISATVNDYLMLVDVTITDSQATRLITGLRGLLNEKLHCMVLEDAYRSISITAEDSEITMDFGQRQTASVSYEQLEEIEYFALDWLLERCKPTTRCNLRLRGQNDQTIDFSLRIQKK